MMQMGGAMYSELLNSEGSVMVVQYIVEEYIRS